MVHRPRILVADQGTIGLDLDYASLAALGDLVLNPAAAVDDLAALLERAAPTVVVANRPRFDGPVIQTGKKAGLALICLTATGTNTVDIDQARNAGVGVCNIRGYSTDAVAQHTFALVLGLRNQCHRFHQDVSRRSWLDTGVYTDLGRPISELAGKTWGLVGLGAIGRKVAEIARAFGARPVYASVSGVDRPEAVERWSLDDLLASADIISIHAPMSELSKGLLDYRRLCQLKPDALLVNVGRGGIVVEADLARALREGRLAGAGLDVLWPEPPDADNPLLAPDLADRLLITPHVAWAAREARQRAVDETARNVAAWLAGERRNRVD